MKQAHTATCLISITGCCCVTCLVVATGNNLSLARKLTSRVDYRTLHLVYFYYTIRNRAHLKDARIASRYARIPIPICIIAIHLIIIQSTYPSTYLETCLTSSPTRFPTTAAPLATLYHGQRSFSSWPYRPNSAFHQGVPLLAEVEVLTSCF
jgi:hypothetical protein